MLLRLNRLVETVRVAAARHDTSGKFVYDQNFIILYHIILVAEHEVIGPQSQDNIVLNLQILRICQVVDMEILLHLLNTLFCQVYHLVFFIYYKITSFLNLLTHDGIYLGKFLGNRTAL